MFTLLAWALTGCVLPEDSDTDLAPGPEEPGWSYAGSTGPAYWGELDEAWVACSEGTAQSPIDIAADGLLAGDDELQISWGETRLLAYNSGHYIRYEVDPGSTVTTVDGTYDLLQFHFHGLSEHTVDGEHLDMEVHFVHQDQDDPDRLLVIAMFVDEGGDIEVDALGEGGALRFHDALALTVSEEPTELGGTADLGLVASTLETYVAYDGSLTTPPCTEGVRFYLSGEVLRPARADIEAFWSLYAHNYRPTQPLNGRDVLAFDP
jgi:carbonic anhydrase